jgi:hypothetical protein
VKDVGRAMPSLRLVGLLLKCSKSTDHLNSFSMRGGASRIVFLPSLNTPVYDSPQRYHRQDAHSAVFHPA